MVYRVGDRVESTAGDDKGERGFVTAIVPDESTPVHWTTDSGSRIRCIPKRIRHVPPNPPDWVPHCGDRVTVLVKDQKGRFAFVVNTKNPQRLFVELRDSGVAGPYASEELELVSRVVAGEHERQTTEEERLIRLSIGERIKEILALRLQVDELEARCAAKAKAEADVADGALEVYVQHEPDCTCAIDPRCIQAPPSPCTAPLVQNLRTHPGMARKWLAAFVGKAEAGEKLAELIDLTVAETLRGHLDYPHNHSHMTLRDRIKYEIERYDGNNDSADAIANCLTVIVSRWPLEGALSTSVVARIRSVINTTAWDMRKRLDAISSLLDETWEGIRS